MKVCVWNVHGATQSREDVWSYFLEINADIALLQEVGSVPDSVASVYSVLDRKAVRKNGQPQRFSTVVLVKGLIDKPLFFSTKQDWVNQELERFNGNLIAAEVTLASGDKFRVVSAYSPPWPIDPERLEGVDVSGIKLSNNPDVWVTELLWAALSSQDLDELPWIVAGDLNSSVTFDTMWGNAPRGNQEIQDRMSALGFIECLLSSQGRLSPTFKNAHGGKVIHQMDHLYVPDVMKSRLLSCVTGDDEHVFNNSLSDHLPIIAEFE